MDQGENRQNILIISGVIALIIATIAAIYFVFFYDGGGEENGEPPTFGETSETREGTNPERESDRESGSGVFDPESRLRLVHEEPTAGATTVLKGSEPPTSDETETDTTKDEFVRLLERESSHVFDVDLESLEKERLSSTTIPRIHEAIWTSGGDRVILRYLDEDNQTIKTYTAALVEKESELEAGETPFELSGEFLQDDIPQLVSSPKGSEIFWLDSAPTKTTGIVSAPDGTNQSAVFSSSFSEWLPQWFSSGTVNMTTKASGRTDGYSYDLPISTGQLERNIGDEEGLTTLTNPDGSYILYSVSGRSNLSVHIYNTATGNSRDLFIETLPEKCVWADTETAYCGVPEDIGSGMYPDVWYKGQTSFSDSIFEIDASEGNAQEIYSPSETDSENIDIYKPFISESEEYLIFNNKADMSLWAFSLDQTEELIIPGVDEVDGL
ncbi:MAG: hypothetical protein U5L75_03130 [Candidatus Campbellbacteria bacterium]|nr:hypothetical protein [Candidatus Campbellbacteria bacterium]